MLCLQGMQMAACGGPDTACVLQVIIAHREGKEVETRSTYAGMQVRREYTQRTHRGVDEGAREVEHIIHHMPQHHHLLLQHQLVLAQRGGIHDVVDEGQQAGPTGADDADLLLHLGGPGEVTRSTSGT